VIRPMKIKSGTKRGKGTRWHSWLGHCATSRKVADLVPDGVVGFLHWHYPCGRTVALGVDSASNSNIYTHVNKNPSAWNFLSPKPEVACGTVAIIIQVVLLSPYLRIRAVSLSSIHYNQSHRVFINRRRQYICLIWN